MLQEKIIRNSARCRKCGDEIVSTHVHDHRRCGCGAIAVDGGTEYMRRIGAPENFEETSITEPWPGPKDAPEARPVWSKASDQQRTEMLWQAARLGYELSLYAAAVHPDGEQTPEWCEGLLEQCQQLQSMYRRLEDQNIPKSMRSIDVPKYPK